MGDPKKDAPQVQAAVASILMLTASDGEHGSWAAGAEQMEGIGETTGYQGGDAGHGGFAAVTFDITGGSHYLRVTLPPGAITDAVVNKERDKEGNDVVTFDLCGDPMTVRLVARGDWEQAGLVVALRKAWLALAPDLERAMWPIPVLKPERCLT